MACKGLHQILVDTNRYLLNEKNLSHLNNLLKKKAKGPYRLSYNILYNAPDTIPLPSGLYKKVLFRKSLHELNDMDKMIDEAHRILISQGSLIIIEANPQKPNQTDPGCKKKYLTPKQIQEIVTARGFYLVEHQKEFIRKNQVNKKVYFNVLKFQKSG
jgi:ubiquinone/menaquinone biosynthesis C-methylase UbiE